MDCIPVETGNVVLAFFWLSIKWISQQSHSQFSLNGNLNIMSTVLSCQMNSINPTQAPPHLIQRKSSLWICCTFPVFISDCTQVRHTVECALNTNHLCHRGVTNLPLMGNLISYKLNYLYCLSHIQQYEGFAEHSSALLVPR